MQNYNFENIQMEITANYFELLCSLLSWVTAKQQNTEDRLSDFEARTRRIFSRVVALTAKELCSVYFVFRPLQHSLFFFVSAVKVAWNRGFKVDLVPSCLISTGIAQ